MTTTKTAQELGRKGASYFVEDTCIDCGFTRWVQQSHLQWAQKTGVYTGLCRPCSSAIKLRALGKRRGADNPNWKGGRVYIQDGYVRIRLAADDPFRCMAFRGGYVREHRYVVAKALGRPLERWEVVHHKNGIKDDNRPENLELLSDPTEHLPSVVTQGQFKVMENRIQTLEQRVLLLEADNTLLRATQQEQVLN